jgi:hypothetical protein
MFAYARRSSVAPAAQHGSGGIPAFKFVLIFMALLLSEPHRAARMPIANPLNPIAGLPGIPCGESRWRLGHTSGNLPKLL